MYDFTFQPEYQTLAKVQGCWPAEDLLKQQGMYGADIKTAYQHATEPLKTILDAIPENYKQETAEKGLELNIDVRVHELQKGDYPASPGWHCDAPQRETSFSDSSDSVEVNKSLVVNLSSNPNGTSNTVFYPKPLTMRINDFNKTTWTEMDKILGTNLDGHHASKDGELVQFSPYAPHCIQPTQNNGVRMFIRISQWEKPEWFTPGLTKTEQVYRTVKQ